MSAQMEINRAKLCRVRVGSNGDFMIMEHQQLLIVSGNILKGGGSRVLPNMPMDEEVYYFQISVESTLIMT
jgi:hypothetical protein